MTNEEIKELKGLAASMGLYDDRNPCKRAVILGKAIKALEQELKTGHWIYKQYGGYPECGDYHCSECDKIDNRIPAYCPHCGARMVEPQESEADT